MIDDCNMRLRRLQEIVSDIGESPTAARCLQARVADSSKGFCTHASRISGANTDNNANISKAPTGNRRKDTTMIFLRFIHQLDVQKAISPMFGIVPQDGIDENNELSLTQRGCNSR
jgi:hypothetical protein